MWQSIIGLMLVTLMPLALVKGFTILDNEYRDRIKLDKRSIIIIIACGIGFTVITFNMPKMIGTEHFLNYAFLTGYLIFMSYTDQKIKQLYSVVTVLVIIVESVILALNISKVTLDITVITTIAVVLVLFVMSLFNWIGMGDVLIYTALAIYLTRYSMIPMISLVMNILLTNLLFIISAIILKLAKIEKYKGKNRPLTLYIALSTFICNLLLI